MHVWHDLFLDVIGYYNIKFVNAKNLAKYLSLDVKSPPEEFWDSSQYDINKFSRPHLGKRIMMAKPLPKQRMT